MGDPSLILPEATEPEAPILWRPQQIDPYSMPVAVECEIVVGDRLRLHLGDLLAKVGLRDAGVRGVGCWSTWGMFASGALLRPRLPGFIPATLPADPCGRWFCVWYIDCVTEPHIPDPFLVESIGRGTCKLIITAIPRRRSP